MLTARRICEVDKLLSQGESIDGALETLINTQFIYHDELTKIEHLLKLGANPNRRIITQPKNSYDPILEQPLLDFYLEINPYELGMFSEVIELLMKFGGKFDTVSHRTLENCARKGKNALIQQMVDDGVDININNSIALKRAVIESHISTVELLIGLGSDVNSEINHPLSYVCDGRSHEKNLCMMKILVQAGSDPKANSSEAIFKAVVSGNLVLVEFLVASGANVNDQGGKLVDECIRNGNDKTKASIIRFILKNDFDIEPRKEYILEACCNDNSVEVLDLMLEAGIEFLADDDIGLRYACMNNKIKIAERLLKLGANPNCSSGAAISIAVRSWKSDMLKLLISYNADARINNSRAIKWAIRSGTDETIDILLGAGVDLSVLDEKDLKAIRIARIFVKLLRNGFEPDRFSREKMISELISSLNIELLDLLVEKRFDFSKDKLVKEVIREHNRPNSKKCIKFLEKMVGLGMEIGSGLKMGLLAEKEDVVEFILRTDPSHLKKINIEDFSEAKPILYEILLAYS